MPEADSRATGLLRALARLVYAPRERLVEGVIAHRLRDAGATERLAYHDRGPVAALANRGMSTQLPALGAGLVAGRPAAFAWVALAELALVLVLALRRELVIRVPAVREESA
jgi:hypothetical protein